MNDDSNDTTIHELNASLYDTCPHCGKSKPIASATCFECFTNHVADLLDD